MFTRRALLGTVATTTLIGVTSSMATAVDKPPAIFLSPHCDDLLLSMGVSIVEHLQAGRKCVFVLLTQGASQWVIDSISARAGTPVTTEMVALSRVKELSDEVAAYNTVGRGTLSLNTYKDGTLQTGQVKGVVRALEALYPGADYKTMTHLDSHSDHSASGKAIQQMRWDGEIKTAPRYYVKDQDRQRVSGLVSTFAPQIANSTQQAVINKAANGYKVWDPWANRFSVGYISVPGSFAEIAAGARNVIHA